MLRKRRLTVIALILIVGASILDAAPLRVQLVGLPLHESEPEYCTAALAVVGSYIPGVSTVQFAPGYSISNTIVGLQLGGVFSICRTLQAHQLSIGFNICSENRGQQIAGVFNHSSLLEGRQIGIINSAVEGDGLQIGVFNHAGKKSIRSIGLINIRKSGILRWLTSVDQNGDVVTGLQSGGERLYTVLLSEITDQSSSIAIGGHLKAARLFGDIEAGIFIPSDLQEGHDLSGLMRFRPGVSLTASLNIFASIELRIDRGSGGTLYGSAGIAWGR